MANKKKHLTYEERFCIEKLIEKGISNREIGIVVDRGKTTISDEINRNGGRGKYNAKKAHHRAYLRQYWKKKGCNKVSLDGDLSRLVEKMLSKGVSPEAIAMRLKRLRGYQHVSGKSIRKFINKRPGLERFLFWNRIHMKSGPKRRGVEAPRDNRRYIEQRPIEAEYMYGHWEGDFIVSKHNKYVLLVLVERYSKNVLMKLLPHRKNDLVNEAICSLLQGYTVQSVTLDNDIAFLKWKTLEAQLDTNIYFTHPYCSWEKGLVENMNRWIRKFAPKRSNLALLTDTEVQSIQDWLNYQPRVCLEGSSAYEVMQTKEKDTFVSSLLVDLPVVGGRIWG